VGYDPAPGFIPEKGGPSYMVHVSVSQDERGNRVGFHSEIEDIFPDDLGSPTRPGINQDSLVDAQNQEYRSIVPVGYFRAANLVDAPGHFYSAHFSSFNPS
jgi:hypothetical protein